jgi:hypothetical protein
MGQKQALETAVMKLSSVKGGSFLAFCSEKTNSKLNRCVHPPLMYDVENQVKWHLNQLNTSVE